MKELPVIDAADQIFSTVLNNRRVTIRLRYAPSTDRWSMDLAVDDEPLLYGRKIVLGTDILAAYDFGIGSIIALKANGGYAEPNRENLPSGVVRLYHYDESDLAAV